MFYPANRNSRQNACCWSAWLVNRYLFRPTCLYTSQMSGRRVLLRGLLSHSWHHRSLLMFDRQYSAVKWVTSIAVCMFTGHQTCVLPGHQTCTHHHSSITEGLVEISAYVDMLCACATRTACSPSSKSSISDKPRQDDCKTLKNAGEWSNEVFVYASKLFSYEWNKKWME